MLTPSVRSCSMLAAALFASVALTAAPAFAQAGKPAPATPQAALDALEAAITAADARSALALITPDGQKRLTKDAVMGSLAMLAFMDPNDPNPMGPKPSATELAAKQKAYTAAKTAISAALKPSGLDAALGKPLMPAQEIVDAKIGTVDPVTLVPALFDAAVKAGPGLGMKEKPEPKAVMNIGNVTGYSITGDKAIAKNGPVNMNFIKIDNRWYIVPPPGAK